ncbi:MAG TPA: hypothetical protein VMH86_12225 [Rhizomicrobium sp.]|nr:hypothetical protein [Rhizomicrobium sp.]
MRALVYGAVLAAALAAPAFATADHVVNFTFSGSGRHPSVKSIKEYILGCLPNKTRTFGGDPGDSAGPWDVETPAIKDRELSNDDVKLYLSVCKIRPSRVATITVTDD